jgi:alkaline phosphatase D
MSKAPQQVSRRVFLAMAATMGVSAAWAAQKPHPSRLVAKEARGLYPEGVASGDPGPYSVLLWTRRPFSHGEPVRLKVEVAEDEEFFRVIAQSHATVSAKSDWTCRVLACLLVPVRRS